MSYQGKYNVQNNELHHTGNGNILKDLNLLRKIIVLNNKFIVYNTRNFNAYSIDRLIPVGHFDPDNNKYRFTKNYSDKKCSYISNNKMSGGKNKCRKDDRYIKN
jgi:hypothetical protein